MSVWQDLRYGSRLWRQHKVPALLSIGMLAIGIAAATAIFTIVNAILIKPLPYRDADRLVMVWGINERLGIDVERQKTQTSSMSLLEYQDWLSRSGIFDNIVIWTSTFPRVTQTDDPVNIQVYRTSPGVFPLLGVRPCLAAGSSRRMNALVRPGDHPAARAVDKALRAGSPSHRAEAVSGQPAAHHHRRHACRLCLLQSADGCSGTAIYADAE
jgi:hypothetical protein